MHKAAALLFAAAVTAAQAQTAISYQKPPAPIEALLDAPQTPTASVSPDRKTLLIQQPQDFPTIADVAEPRLRLAGLRFNTATSGPSRTVAAVALKLQAITPGAAARPIAGLPTPLRATEPLWSPDSRQIAFIQRTLTAPTPNKTAALKQNSAGLDLYLIDVATARAHRVGTVHLNAVLGAPCAWMPDSSALACNIVSPTRGPAPKLSDIPTGPDVSENLGRVSPAPTYEDMLKTPADEQQFEFYATAQLALIPAGPRTAALRTLPVKGLLDTPSPSPDGRFLLLAELHRPFSYTVPAESFPLKTSVLTLKTGTLKLLNDRPLIDNLPISRDATVAGPRDYEWRSDAPATLVWAEAANKGIPKPGETIADRLYTLLAPFDAPPTLLYEAPMRLAGGRRGAGIEWGTDHLALVSMARFSDRKSAIVAIDPSAPVKPATTLYQGSSQDRYNAPGRPLTQRNAAGKTILTLTPDGSAILFVSPGASPKGDQPFLAALPLVGGPKQILFRSADPFYADPIALLTPTTLLIRRESATESPNYFVAQLSSRQTPTQLTTFPSPYAGQSLPTKQLLKYKRADGLDLTATLWLPAGYTKSQGPLPTLMEAYPAEFKSRATAAQVAGSPNRFPRIGWGSPVFFAQTGYAVLENAAIPIIGEGDAQPNDTYTEQLVAAAKAAIDYGASLGVVDPTRVAVMGHSYGAFMTANLLAHSTLFRAGIARSGAYNRSLTPYGFQNEERTYWQAPQVYNAMSPFAFADKIKTPILLIHGEADDNTGTYPIQSERFYAALKGQGATVRLVFLPLEAHGYEAHESLSHMLWEMSRWLDTYVKPTTPVIPTPTTTATN